MVSPLRLFLFINIFTWYYSFGSIVLQNEIWQFRRVLTLTSPGRAGFHVTDVTGGQLGEFSIADVTN